jgi:hypothetical protein
MIESQVRTKLDIYPEFRKSGFNLRCTVEQFVQSEVQNQEERGEVWPPQISVRLQWKSPKITL